MTFLLICRLEKFWRCLFEVLVCFIDAMLDTSFNKQKLVCQVTFFAHQLSSSVTVVPFWWIFET